MGSSQLETRRVGVEVGVGVGVGVDRHGRVRPWSGLTSWLPPWLDKESADTIIVNGHNYNVHLRDYGNNCPGNNWRCGGWAPVNVFAEVGLKVHFLTRRHK